MLRLSGMPLSYVRFPFFAADINFGVGTARTFFLAKRILMCVSGVSPVALSTSFANGVSSSAGAMPSIVDALSIVSFTI